MQMTKGIIGWVKHIECVAEMSNYTVYSEDTKKREDVGEERMLLKSN